MSPEQAAGKVGEIGPTTDVYALGATLYELLTGRPPFRGETVQEILDLVKNEAPEPPHAYKPRVDRSLEAICMQCLKKTAQDRYASAQALAEDLERFRDGEPVHAQNGAVRGAIGAIMRECRHAEFIRLWGPGLMANGIGFFLFCVAWYLLVANRVEQFAPYYAILVAKAVFDYGLLVWWFRLKNGPPFRHFERQILRVLSFFWILVFLTVWQYQLAGGPVAGLLPILVLELAFSFTCAAIILGGSFYTTAAAFFGAAVLQSLWPEYGTLILATTALVLFWVGWKYARRAPPA
jgi:serine/threonine-protein kinase